MTDFDVVPITTATPTVPAETTDPPTTVPRRRVSRLLVTGLVVTMLALGGAAYFQQDASTDRNEAVRDREHATTQLRLQRDRTETAESASRQARAAVRVVSGAATMVVDLASPFVALGDRSLDAERAVQAIGPDPEAVDQYNAAVGAANAIVDQYNAEIQALLDRIDDLRGSVEA